MPHISTSVSENWSTDRWHYTYAGNAAALLFTLFHTLTHKNVTAGQRGLPEHPSLFLPLCWLPFIHISRFTFPPTFTPRQKTTSSQPFLATSYEKMMNFVDHRQQDVQLKCFSLLVSIVIRIQSQQLFRTIIQYSHWKQMCHLSGSSPALPHWAYNHVLAHLNTCASHANDTESGAVALVAMQPLN